VFEINFFFQSIRIPELFLQYQIIYKLQLIVINRNRK